MQKALFQNLSWFSHSFKMLECNSTQDNCEIRNIRQFSSDMVSENWLAFPIHSLVHIFFPIWYHGPLFILVMLSRWLFFNNSMDQLWHFLDILPPRVTCNKWKRNLFVNLKNKQKEKITKRKKYFISIFVGTSWASIRNHPQGCALCQTWKILQG